MRIVVVSHALVQEASRARWRRLAERSDVTVTLLVPARWTSSWFGGSQVWRPKAVEDGRFRVIPVPLTSRGNWYRYLFRSLDAHLRELRPDVLFVVQEELTLVLQQMLVYRRIWAPAAKLVFFSWNNLGVPSRSRLARLFWSRVAAGADAAVAGSTEIRRVLQRAGFRKPIHIQTEIGIDEEKFRPDERSRCATRSELGLQGFVIGFSGRLVDEKGVLDLADALAGLSGDWTALFVGDGALRTELEARAQAGGWRNRLRITGLVEVEAMPSLMRAMDCLVLPSRTTGSWKEQFGLVLAQAMACGTPVIGSSSGAIPEVIGDAGMVFPEGEAGVLRDRIERLRGDDALRASMARDGIERSRRYFSASGLADDTYAFFSSLLDRSEGAS